MPDPQRQLHRGRFAQAGGRRRTEKRRQRKKHLLFSAEIVFALSKQHMIFGAVGLNQFILKIDFLLRENYSNAKI